VQIFIAGTIVNPQPFTDDGDPGNGGPHHD
jgi:hypothetical protein